MGRREAVALKIKTEICTDGEEEILIRCRSKTDHIKKIASVLENLLVSDREMVLYLSGAEHFVPLRDILFFEALDGKVYAHTNERMFTCDHKLFELESILPSYFARISKSNIANIMLVASLRRELAGNGEITFRNCDKKAYFSRGYYKILRDKINEMRLGK